MSSILRSFLLGSAYIFRHKQLREEHRKHLSSRTDAVLSKARNKFSNASLGDSPPASSPITATGSSKDPSGSPATTYFANSPSVGNASTHAPDGSLLSPSGRIRRHVVDHSANEIRDALHVGRREHMSEIDCTVRYANRVYFRTKLTIISCFCRTARVSARNDRIVDPERMRLLSQRSSDLNLVVLLSRWTLATGRNYGRWTRAWPSFRP